MKSIQEVIRAVKALREDLDRLLEYQMETSEPTALEELEGRVAVLERNLPKGLGNRRPIQPPPFPAALSDLGLTEPSS